MNNITKNHKRSRLKNLLKIEQSEEKTLLYFLALFALPGISSAVSKASAYALFLSSYYAWRGHPRDLNKHVQSGDFNVGSLSD